MCRHLISDSENYHNFIVLDCLTVNILATLNISFVAGDDTILKFAYLALTCEA